MKRVWLGLLIIASVGSAGCSVFRDPVSIDSQDTDLKVQAIKQDVDRHNQADVGKMVADLESEDAAVRFYSIEGLRRLTQDEFGYHYYESESQRAPAVARWKQWLKARDRK